MLNPTITDRLYENILLFLVIANLILAFIFSPFIGKLNSIHYLSGTLTILATCWMLPTVFFSRCFKYFDFIFLSTVFYYLVIAAWYVMFGVELNEVIRAYLSFLYLPMFALICSRLSKHQLKTILLALFTLGFFVALMVIPFFIQLIQAKLSYNRFTAYLDITHTPIFIIILPLCFLLLSKFKYYFVAIVIVAIFATQSKGQVLMALLVLLACEIVSNKASLVHSLKVVSLIFLCSLPTTFFNGSTDDLSSKNPANRLGDLRGDTTIHRVKEILLAKEYALKNPIFGVGPTTEFHIRGIATSENNPRQRYIHNVVMYFLATGGVVGFLVYIAPYFTVLIGGINSKENKLLLISILGSFGYLLVSATFKSIQTNMFLGVLIGCSIVYSGVGCSPKKTDG